MTSIGLQYHNANHSGPTVCTHVQWHTSTVIVQYHQETSLNTSEEPPFEEQAVCSVEVQGLERIQYV